MTRKILTVLLLALLLSVAAFAQPEMVGVENADEITQEAAKEETAELAATYTEGYFTYSVSNGKATITDCDTSISGDVVIPDTLGGYPVTCIGDYAFYECTSLASITIPDSVTSIGYDAFYYCTSLACIIVDTNNTKYSSYERGALFNKDKTTLIQYPIGHTATSYDIPDSVTRIGDSAFSMCTSLTSIEIPDSVTSIGYSAFSGCCSLESVIFGENSQLVSIDTTAFSSCTSLTNIEIPNSVTSIRLAAFAGCESLTSIKIPNRLTMLSSYVFRNCTSLKCVTFEENSALTEIAYGAFYECPSLTNVTIYIKDLNFYDSEVFYDCPNLTLYGYEGSTTEDYANANNIPFITIDDSMVIYDANGGTGAPKSQFKKHNEELVLSDVVPIRTGYTFLGWSTSSSGNVAYNPDDTYTANEDITLYAVWVGNEYTITYDANGGTGAPESQTKTYGTNITLSSVVPEREGYNFKGWSTSSAATSSSYSAGGIYTDKSDEDITLYAVWQEKTYSVTYNANGGTSAPNSQTKYYFSELTLRTNIPTRTGYTFLGWSTRVDGEIEYNPGNIYSINEDICLYAIWDAYDYIISFDANGGSGASESITKTYGTTLYLPSTVPTREGYTFKGWATSADGNVVYNSGSSYTKNEGATLYAVWELKTYSVTYNANSGSNVPSSQTKKYFDDLVLSTSVPSRTGYTFLGWSSVSGINRQNLSVSGIESAHNYSDNTNKSWTISHTGAKSIELTFDSRTQFESNYDYLYIYDKNGTQVGKYSGTTLAGQTITVESDFVTLKFTSDSSNTFWGFKVTSAVAIMPDEEVDVNVEYLPGDTYTENKALSLYAVWQLKTYLVTYDAGHGIIAPEMQTKNYFDTLYLSSEVPLRTGYDFLGWSTSVEGKVEYNSGDSYTKNEELKLYAVWQLKTYSVTYNANGGENAPEVQIKEYFNDIVLSENIPTRNGFDFLGWSTTIDGETEYVQGNIYSKNEDATLYAIWIRNVSGTCGFNLKWHLYGTKLTVAGTGSMTNWSESANVPWNAHKSKIETVVISDGATSIGSYAFSDCENLKTVTFTESVTKINSHAFDNATSIEAINFTGSLGNLESIEISGYNDSFMNGSFNFDYVITYTITYNTLGGMSDIQEQSKKHGEPTTLSTLVPKKVGHKFLGWSVEQGGEIVYNAGDEYTENADIVLYAVWEEVMGDASGDGEITNEDITIVADAIFGKTLTEEEFRYANVYDEDNEINVKDLIKLAQMMSQNK